MNKRGRLWPRNDEERAAAEAAGYDLAKVLTQDDMVRGDNCFFAATGISDGELLDGVKFSSASAQSQSLVMRSLGHGSAGADAPSGEPDARLISARSGDRPTVCGKAELAGRQPVLDAVGGENQGPRRRRGCRRRRHRGPESWGHHRRRHRTPRRRRGWCRRPESGSRRSGVPSPSVSAVPSYRSGTRSWSVESRWSGIVPSKSRRSPLQSGTPSPSVSWSRSRGSVAVEGPRRSPAPSSIGNRRCRRGRGPVGHPVGVGVGGTLHRVRDPVAVGVEIPVVGRLVTVQVASSLVSSGDAVAVEVGVGLPSRTPSSSVPRARPQRSGVHQICRFP
ncbi:MAG: fructose-bisphosphatase class II [Microthrixaceae bacterium]